MRMVLNIHGLYNKIYNKIKNEILYGALERLYWSAFEFCLFVIKSFLTDIHENGFKYPLDK